VLAEYQNFLKKLLRLGEALARDEISQPKEDAAKAPQDVKRPPTPAVAGALQELFDQQPGVRALDKSLGFVWWTVGIVIAIALALKLF
jgi:hypothetical protein